MKNKTEPVFGIVFDHVKNKLNEKVIS